MATQFVSGSPQTFLLPDFLTTCPYPLRLNPYLDDILHDSDKWLVEVCGFSEDSLERSKAAKSALLSATYYPDADAPRLRVCADWLALLFNVDDWFDEYDLGDARALWQTCLDVFRDPNLRTEKRSVLMVKSFFDRFRQTAGPGCTERFIHGFYLFFAASEREVERRSKGYIADLESYIAYRRDTSACKPCYAMIEYAVGIDLPDEVVSHPAIMAMGEAANDMISWSNDIYSYNKEQARGDIHNLVMILMYEQGLDLQGAVDAAGAYWEAALQRFEDNFTILPTWGSPVDQNVAIYVQGLRDMVIGSLHWSFDAERYFGKQGQQIKKDRIVRLLPMKSLL
ncbi:isoprenoid synthase domain-containing protein [Pisolithus orientalis]|uniref:isoprenoid synthase domain-containing protein n=1 Tax=Pisolithus orientalis TaxID=936130 RepID=UPI002224BC31|nr:isoprenoid synthase domain-containing protein [Pisolithus orientalis]KAI6008809.1 isoprenoid synthase domain-containing protein [Pisolithus orientalis]